MYLSHKAAAGLDPALHPLLDAVIATLDLQRTPRFCMSECPDQVYTRLVWAEATPDERTFLVPWFQTQNFNENQFLQPLDSRSFTYPFKNDPIAAFRAPSRRIGLGFNTVVEIAESQIGSLVLARAADYLKQHGADRMDAVYGDLAADLVQGNSPLGKSIHRVLVRHDDFCTAKRLEWFPPVTVKQMVPRLRDSVARHLALRAGMEQLALANADRLDDFVNHLTNLATYLAAAPGTDPAEAVHDMVYTAPYDGRDMWTRWVGDYNEDIQKYQPKRLPAPKASSRPNPPQKGPKDRPENA